MRLSISLFALLAAMPALADEVAIRADVSAGTIYANSAELTRTGSVSLPAGRHRLLIAMPDLDIADRPQLRVEGAEIVGGLTTVSGYPIEEGALDRPDETAAREAIGAAQDALEAAEDALDASRAQVRAAETQLAYLQGLTSGDSMSFPDTAEALTQILGALGAETERAATALREATAAQQPLIEAVEDARAELARAEAALRRLMPFGTAINAAAVEVEMAEAGEVTVELDYLARNASWRPIYRMDLDSETGALDVARIIRLDTPGRERWIDVSLDFSTSDPQRQREPVPVGPDVARLWEPRPQSREAYAAEDSVGGLATLAPAPMVEPVVMAEAVMNGLSLTYDYQRPVTVTGTGAELPFDTLEFEADLTNIAVPRRQETAYLVAEFENDAGEPLIPGDVQYYRDGALIGDGYLELLAAGDEAEIAFGAVDHIALDWQDLSRDAGDRGVFVQSNVENRRVRFGATNLSDAPETVRIVYATPFSEIEDLEVEVSLSEEPTERDIDDLRGVHAWEVTLAPGESYEVEMTVEMSWPTDMNLDWQP
ncbi:mucoidy inhibitor MuiA family protein [Rhodobacterales bacterium HKCCE3408]|nr:mucoidy inhibitor MuiA family protein [Rhodobacterales bacterium HKCCE3408]